MKYHDRIPCPDPSLPAGLTQRGIERARGDDCPEQSRWEIEFIPDDPETPQAENVTAFGTYSDAQAVAEAEHPGYICKEIAFHRM